MASCHWRFGPVLENLDDLLPRLAEARVGQARFRSAQIRGFAETFAKTPETPSSLAAGAIAEIIGRDRSIVMRPRRSEPRWNLRPSKPEIWAVGLASCLQGFLGPQSPHLRRSERPLAGGAQASDTPSKRPLTTLTTSQCLGFSLVTGPPEPVRL